jgi:hypothetical protein
MKKYKKNKIKIIVVVDRPLDRVRDSQGGDN